MDPQHDSQKPAPERGADVVAMGAGEHLPAGGAWQVLSQLVGCLELDALIQAFRSSAGAFLDCVGVTYEAPASDSRIVCGEPAPNQARYGVGVHGEDLGVITLHARRPLGAAALARAEECIGVLVAPLRNALRYEAALRAARTDPLTGLLNRNTMEETLDRELRLARRHDEAFCVLALDLDDFKRVNDTFGHAAGDHVLRELAGVLSRCARESDLVFRVGGDEFVIALSRTDLPGARLLAERLRRAVDRRVFAYEGNVLPVRASVGVTNLQPGDTARTLMRRVDGALFGAKDAGRNRVTLD